MSSISSISKSTQISKQTASPRDKEIQNLMKQRSRVQEELQSVKANDEMDSKTKMDRVKSLTASIQQIDSQISQIRSEEMKEKSKAAVPEQPQKQEPQSREAALMETVVKGNVLYDQLGKLTGVRNRLENSVKTLESENYNDRQNLEFSPAKGEDEGINMMLENAENTVFQMKRDMVVDLEQQIDVTDEQISKLVSSNQPVDVPAQASKEEDEAAVKETDKAAGEEISTAQNEAVAAGTSGAPAVSQPADGGAQPPAQTRSAEPGAVVDVRV
ncbi:FlxA-like family protein [Paenibacillus sp. CAU 1782]